MESLIDIGSEAVARVLKDLLVDKSTKKNIIWATDTYEGLRDEFSDDKQMDAYLLGWHADIIRPRIEKSLEAQAQRTRKKAEVFTPAWLCNKMNNALDEDWFGRENVFNTENDKIKIECDQTGTPYPVIKANPKGGIEVVCNACDLYMKLLKYGRYYDTYPKEEQEDTLDSVQDSMSDEESKSVDRMMDILSTRLSDQEKDKMLPVVEYLKRHEQINAGIVQEIIGKSRRTAIRYINRLLELDVLEKKGDSVMTIYYRK